MRPENLLSSLVAVYPPDGSNVERAGYLPGERAPTADKSPQMVTRPPWQPPPPPPLSCHSLLSRLATCRESGLRQQTDHPKWYPPSHNPPGPGQALGSPILPCVHRYHSRVSIPVHIFAPDAGGGGTKGAAVDRHNSVGPVWCQTLLQVMLHASLFC